MKHRTLGSSGLKVSEIAYGSWISPTEGLAAEVASEALRQGITTFDTADVYGGTRAETVLGQVLKGVRRESVEICTKVYSPTGPGPTGVRLVIVCAGCLFWCSRPAVTLRSLDSVPRRVVRLASGYFR
jgi:aryl-alcohol dehydrogenase-like predicted oxidoreductase